MTPTNLQMLILKQGAVINCLEFNKEDTLLHAFRRKVFSMGNLQRRRYRLTALYLPRKFNDLQGYDTAYSKLLGGKSLIHLRHHVAILNV